MNYQPAYHPSVPSGAWTKVVSANLSRKEIVIVNESASALYRVALQEAQPADATGGFAMGSGSAISTMEANYNGSVWAYQASGADNSELVIQEGF